LRAPCPAPDAGAVESLPKFSLTLAGHAICGRYAGYRRVGFRSGPDEINGLTARAV